METEITRVLSPIQIDSVASLAHEIWSQHYTPIIGEAQVTYMVSNFQSPEAIKVQIAEGFEYYLLSVQKAPVGYFAVRLKSAEELFLSKIYVRNSEQGKGLGKKCFVYICKRAEELRAQHITLTVNKHNYNTLGTYEAWGFKKTGEIVQDIGNGFVMDDYVYTLKIA